jgi:hypothetical protein
LRRGEDDSDTTDAAAIPGVKPFGRHVQTNDCLAFNAASGANATQYLPRPDAVGIRSMN